MFIYLNIKGVDFMKKDKTEKSGSKNGYDMILETYNSHKYPVIENQINAVVFPEGIQRDVDAIDSMRFYTETNEITKERGIEGIPASSSNRTIGKKK